MGLPRSTLVAADPSSAVLTAYAAYMRGAARAIRDSLGSGATDAQIDADVQSVWLFESELAKVLAHYSLFFSFCNSPFGP